MVCYGQHKKSEYLRAIAKNENEELIAANNTRTDVAAAVVTLIPTTPPIPSCFFFNIQESPPVLESSD